MTANGVRYEGDWKNWNGHGRGVKVWANGDRYEGEFRDDKQHGRGVYVAANGDRYEGGFKDGKANGSGTYYSKRDGWSYSGYWTNGCFKQGETRAWIGTSKEACELSDGFFGR